MGEGEQIPHTGFHRGKAEMKTVELIQEACYNQVQRSETSLDHVFKEESIFFGFVKGPSAALRFVFGLSDVL